jgi:pSer/pThr/pTyr-binding forkhead associated (FHA) protein
MPFAFKNESPMVPEEFVASLEVIASPESDMLGRTYALTQERTSIGRASCANIQLSLQGNNALHRVARIHASFFFCDGRYWVEDAQSANGTFVQGAMLRSAHKLTDDDQIDLGAFRSEAGELTPAEVTLRFRRSVT